MATKFNGSFYTDRIFQLLLLSPASIWLLIYIKNPSVSDFETYHLVLVVFFIPVIEEIIFRGILQPWIATRYSQNIAKLSAANLITSSIFSLLHLFTHPVSMAVFTFFPSLIFGYAKDHYGKLTPSIVLYGSYNGGYFLIGTQLINK